MHDKLTLPAARRARLPKDADPRVIIEWAVERFGQQRMVATSAFGMDGCAMLDMLSRRVEQLDVIYVDTDFLFNETYALRDRLAARYPNLNFMRGHGGVSPEEQAAKHGEKLWESNPDLCCQIRKVDALATMMNDVDVWFTSIRRTQSLTRAHTETVAWDWKYELTKICPLAKWTKEQVWAYVQANDVPFNPLHLQQYPSIGCTHCTRAVPGAEVTTESRAGRWQSSEKTECGLHGDGI